MVSAGQEGGFCFDPLLYLLLNSSEGKGLLVAYELEGQQSWRGSVWLPPAANAGFIWGKELSGVGQYKLALV